MLDIRTKGLAQMAFLPDFFYLDLKVWADLSWLLVLKNGLKKVYSLINYLSY